MCGKIGSKFQCMTDKVRFQMFGRKRTEFQFLNSKGGNSNGWKYKMRIPTLRPITQEFQLLKG